MLHLVYTQRDFQRHFCGMRRSKINEYSKYQLKSPRRSDGKQVFIYKIECLRLVNRVRRVFVCRIRVRVDFPCICADYPCVCVDFPCSCQRLRELSDDTLRPSQRQIPRGYVHG